MHISLVGLPGSGKSTMGRHLARLWRLPFIDTDHVIELQLGCAIKDFFAEHGEAAFRDIESQVISELLLCSDRSVLSTGGGAILRAENRTTLKEKSMVFYLQSSPEAIAYRLRNDTTRPLLQGDAPLERLRTLLAQRESLYLDVAHYIVDTNRQNTTQVGRKICMQAELAGLF